MFTLRMTALAVEAALRLRRVLARGERRLRPRGGPPVHRRRDRARRQRPHGHRLEQRKQRAVQRDALWRPADIFRRSHGNAPGHRRGHHWHRRRIGDALDRQRDGQRRWVHDRHHPAHVLPSQRRHAVAPDHLRLTEPSPPTTGGDGRLRGRLRRADRARTGRHLRSGDRRQGQGRPSSPRLGPVLTRPVEEVRGILTRLVEIRMCVRAGLAVLAPASGRHSCRRQPLTPLSAGSRFVESAVAGAKPQPVSSEPGRTAEASVNGTISA